VASKLPNWLLVGGLALAGFITVRGVNLIRNGGLSELDSRSHSTLERKVDVERDPRGDHDRISTSVDSSVAGDAIRPSGVRSTAHSLSQSLSGARKVEQERARPDSVPEDEGPDLRVVGRPFPLSPSIEAECRVDDGCAPLLRLLKQFSQQPRDVVWAAKMEAGLRDLVMSQPGYSIRTIECRASLCAAEVASGTGMFNFITPTGPSGSDPSLSGLFAFYSETAYEHDPAYASVTLMTFRRWGP
jgi:hypothetical protein